MNLSHIYSAIGQRLRELDRGSAMDIADSLCRHRCIGHRGAIENCPLSNWLKPVLPEGVVAFVSANGVEATDDPDNPRAKRTEILFTRGLKHFAAFVRMFDWGDFPELIPVDE